MRLRLLLAGCALAGFAIAAYLTAAHYENVPLACSTSGVVDCGAVTHSSYSVIPGTDIPITVPGLGFFAVGGLLGWLSYRRLLALLLVAWAAAGTLFVLYLVYAEAVVIHRICEWCSGVHLLVLVTLLLAIRQLQSALEAPSPAAGVRPASR